MRGSRKMNMLESIGTQDVERMVQFRVKPGSDLLAAIGEAVEMEEIRAGVIVSGLGALRKAVFRNLKWFPARYPVTPRDRLYLEVEKPLELVSLVGWIAPKADHGAEIHAHFSASSVENETVVTLGGHLMEGTICGIKVVVSILVLSSNTVFADQDQDTQTFDIFFRRTEG
jgi:predicted DNA-binding protein with PD1-like motif